MESAPLSLDPKTTALVLIDLQRGIVARDTKPHSAADVVTRAARLAKTFRKRGALVVLVHVAFSSDMRDRLSPPVDEPQPSPKLPPEWSEFVPELGAGESDVIITKRNWGAFYGTDLDLQLRRRGIRTIVIGGIATNMGVESTARDAWERAYEIVFVKDAMSSFSSEMHEFAMTKIFPRIGRVRSTDEVVAGLGS